MANIVQRVELGRSLHPTVTILGGGVSNSGDQNSVNRICKHQGLPRPTCSCSYSVASLKTGICSCEKLWKEGVFVAWSAWGKCD